MVLTRMGFAAVALTLVASPAFAQVYTCWGWPGSAFGISAYKCTDCAVDSKDQAHPAFAFTAEPIVLQAEAASGFRAGDVIVAVNQQPITAQAGADGFAYPAIGPATVTVRRDGKLQDISRVVQAARCQAVQSTSEKLRAQQVKVRTLLDEVTEKIQAVTVRTKATSAFGFAVDCNPSCSRTRAADGTTLFWRFDGPPSVVRLDPAGPAAVAGVKVGDRLIEVEGVPVTADEGSLLLLKSQERSTLRLTVTRGTERLTFTLKRQ